MIAFFQSLSAQAEAFLFSIFGDESGDRGPQKNPPMSIPPKIRKAKDQDFFSLILSHRHKQQMIMRKTNPFHVAVPVYDLEEARRFYREVLGCGEGRSDTLWTDFDLYGHQFVIHLKPRLPVEETKHHFNPVDSYHDVPVPHFGVVLDWQDWHDLEQRLRKNNIKFVIT